MIYATFPAMGTTIEVWGDRPEQGESVARLFREVEMVCSRFRPESELSRLNADPGPSRHLGPLLAEVVRAADRARRLTGGLVDAGLGAVVAGWGYDRTFPEVAGLEQEPGGLASPGWEVTGDVISRVAGTHLDLGGIAKGWTSDRAVELGLCRVASAGGDLRSSHPDTVATIVDADGSEVTRVRVGVGALATSSVGRRRWRVGQREVAHVIDSRTLAPVESPVMSATAVTATATDAEAAAKAVLLMGEDGLAWADDQPWIRSALVIWHDGSVFATSGIEVAA